MQNPFPFLIFRKKKRKIIPANYPSNPGRVGTSEVDEKSFFYGKKRRKCAVNLGFSGVFRAGRQLTSFIRAYTRENLSRPFQDAVAVGQDHPVVRHRDLMLAEEQ